jgi:hypothetical protein
MYLQRTVGNRATMRFLQESRSMAASSAGKSGLSDHAANPNLRDVVQRVIVNDKGKPYKKLKATKTFKELWRQNKGKAKMLLKKHGDPKNFYNAAGEKVEFVVDLPPVRPSLKRRAKEEQEAKQEEKRTRDVPTFRPRPRKDVLYPPPGPSTEFMKTYVRKGMGDDVSERIREHHGSDESVHAAVFAGMTLGESGKGSMKKAGLSRNHIFPDSKIASVISAAVESVKTSEQREALRKVIETWTDVDSAEAIIADFDAAQRHTNEEARAHAYAATARVIEEASVGAGNIRADDSRLNTAILSSMDPPLKDGRITPQGETAIVAIHSLGRAGIIGMEDAFAIASPAIHVTRDQSGILHGQYLSSSAAESSRLGGGVPWGDITDADTLRAPDRKGWGRLARSNSEPLNLKAVVDRRAERMLPLTEEVVVTNKRKQTSTKEQAEKKLRKEEGETSSF